MLCVMGLVAVHLSGCRKEAEALPPPAEKPSGGVASVEERMADKEYVAELDAQRDQQKKLVKLAGQATNDADRAAVAAALEKNRQETMRIIRERMLRKGSKEISK